MKNTGKKFEENFKKSVPEDIFFYRFRDSASSYYGGNQGLRFSAANIADCIIFSPPILHLIELKSHKGKSIPLECIIGNKTKLKQISDLQNADNYNGVYSSIIVFFEDVGKCYELPISKFVEFCDKNERKSIPISYFQENGYEIKCEKIVTNYKYDINDWLIQF